MVMSMPLLANVAPRLSSLSWAGAGTACSSSTPPTSALGLSPSMLSTGDGNGMAGMDVMCKAGNDWLLTRVRLLIAGHETIALWSNLNVTSETRDGYPALTPR